MVQKYELDAVYYQGLREMGDVDAAVAEDLGIPTSPESFEHHVTSGLKVAGKLTESAARSAILHADGGEEHALLEALEGRIICANCNRPGCAGCGRS